MTDFEMWQFDCGSNVQHPPSLQPPSWSAHGGRRRASVFGTGSLVCPQRVISFGSPPPPPPHSLPFCRRGSGALHYLIIGFWDYDRQVNPGMAIGASSRRVRRVAANRAGNRREREPFDSYVLQRTATVMTLTLNEPYLK
jgi:hypothetical protein